MAHDTGDADIGDVHYEVPVDAAGNKTNALGRWLDNLGRGALGGEGVGGQPTDILGVLPQAPTRGVNGDISIEDLNRMREAMSGAEQAPPFIGGEGFDLTGDDTGFIPPTEISPTRADPGGTVGQRTDPLAQVDPLEAFGGLGPDGRTTFPPEGQPATGAAVPAGAAPPAPVPPVPNPYNRTGPGDILSGVGLNTEVDRPYEGNPRLAGAAAVAAPAAGMFALNPATAATVLGQGVRTGAANVAGGIRQAPSFIQMIKNWLGLPGRQAMGQTTRAVKKAAGKKARGKVKQVSKTKATKRTTKGKAEAARQRKAAEKRAKAAAGTRLGGG